MKTRKKETKKRKHVFHINVDMGGHINEVKAFAEVKPGTKTVKLVVTAEDIRRAIELDGIGTTHKCVMAICALRHKDAFNHVIAGGTIDWNYKSCHVVTKLDRKTGLPKECRAYEHHDKVAKLFDTKAGLRKLLADVEKSGPKTITLYPPKKRKQNPLRDHSANPQHRRVNGELAESGNEAKRAYRGAVLRIMSAKAGPVEPVPA